MNSLISGYSVKCSFFSAAPLATANAELLYSSAKSKTSNSRNKSQDAGSVSKHTNAAQKTFACTYPQHASNATYAMSLNSTYNYHVGKGLNNKQTRSEKDQLTLITGLMRTVPAGKFK